MAKWLSEASLRPDNISRPIHELKGSHDMASKLTWRILAVRRWVPLSVVHRATLLSVHDMHGRGRHIADFATD